MHASARQHHRVDEHYQTVGRLETRVPTVEYVNRQGDRVSPTTGRPINKPPDSSTNGANGVPKRTRGPRRRRRKTVPEGSMFGNLEPIPRDATCDPPPKACFNCWQQGHLQQVCPRPSTTRYCNNCGRQGEDVRTCPRCSRAHKEYLSRQQNREREEVELEEVLGGSLVHEQEDANDDGCDEVLRELNYRDDRERELGRSSYSRDAYKPGPSMHDQRQRDRSSHRDREDEEYIRRDYNAYNSYYSKQQDDERRDSRSTSHQQDREHEDDYLPHGREYRSESYKERNDREEYYRYREERDRDYNARASRSRSRNDELESKHKLNYFDNVDLNADPVQEVLQLAKSIAHLTPETQDLIMRQVMAEREERVRLRAMKLQERHTDDWS